MRVAVSRSAPYQNGLIDRISMSTPIASIARSRPSTPLARKCSFTPRVGGRIASPAPPIRASASSKMQWQCASTVRTRWPPTDTGTRA